MNQRKELPNEAKQDLGRERSLCASLSRDPRFLLILARFLPEGWLDSSLVGAGDTFAPAHQQASQSPLHHLCFYSFALPHCVLLFSHHLLPLFHFPRQPFKLSHLFLAGDLQQRSDSEQEPTQTARPPRWASSIKSLNIYHI